MWQETCLKSDRPLMCNFRFCTGNIKPAQRNPWRNTQCHEVRRFQKWWIAFKNYLKQLHVFEKNQNFSVYIKVIYNCHWLPSLLHSKSPSMTLTMKSFLYITKTCNMHISQKCHINTISLKTLKKLLKIIQKLYVHQA